MMMTYYHPSSPLLRPLLLPSQENGVWCEFFGTRSEGDYYTAGQ